MKRIRPWGIAILLLLTACAGPGERYPVSLSYQNEFPLPHPSGPLQRVTVFPLEDRRTDPQWLGRRIHLFGQVDTFESRIPVGPGVTDLLILALRQRGWDAHLPAPGIRPSEVTGERVLTGTIKSLRADATSHLGYTQIEAQFTWYAEILNPSVGGKISFAADDQSTPKVFIFRASVLEKTLNQLVSESLRRVQISGDPGIPAK